MGDCFFFCVSRSVLNSVTRGKRKEKLKLRNFNHYEHHEIIGLLSLMVHFIHISMIVIITNIHQRLFYHENKFT
jgi:hypothetical protein